MVSTPPIVPGPEPYTLSNLMPAPTPPSRRPGWVVPLVVGLAVLVLATGGLAAWALLRPTATPAAVGTSPTRINVVAPPNDPPAVVTYPEPRAEDFRLTVKVLKKECFGSAGCLVDFRIELAYGGPTLDPSVTYELTYEIKGGDEPLINTLEVTGDQYSTEKEETIEAGAKAKLTAKVTLIDKV